MVKYDIFVFLFLCIILVNVSLHIVSHTADLFYSAANSHLSRDA